ncbi:stage III sporulation protein AA [Thermoactinomyces daqus]|uniref:Stage III sporulation protein AA n=1 Tax=Thermoactinomyces daqus TaxID=1329516 RepID=A0A7W2AK37_9BACL|nr:stage III sporulation protein AA [Thermoactinomyces daqus]
MKPVLRILPLALRELIQSLPRTILESLEEIRIRQDRPLEIITSEQSWFVNHLAQLTHAPRGSFLPGKEDCLKILNLISNHSLYAMDEELRKGFVTIEGGHRVGLVGRVVMEQGKVKLLRDVTGFNVRIARQIKGVGESLIPFVFPHGRAENVLIVSPPQCGKTTLIRDLARLASLGGDHHRSHKVGIVDERSEIAGSVGGVPQHDLGPRTDVLDACPKAEGMMMMIRSMSPDILVVDEIGSKEDSQAVHEAVYAGIRLFVTIHGQSVDEIRRRPILSELMEEEVFSRVIVLSRSKGPGTVEAIYNHMFEPLDLSVSRSRKVHPL